MTLLTNLHTDKLGVTFHFNYLVTSLNSMPQP